MSANEPLIISTVPVLIALFLGNSVLLKPSSKSPFFSYYLTKKLYELGLPTGLLSYLPADKNAIKSLLGLGKVDAILSFASSETNRILAADAAESGVEISIENEGNDWVYVDKNPQDSFQELAQTLVKGITKHNGQMCDSIRGILVHEDVYDQLVPIMKELLTTTNCGNPLDINSDIGTPLEGTLPSIVNFINQVSSDTSIVYNYSLTGNVVTPALIFLENNELLSSFEKPLFGPIAWIKKVTDFTEVVNIYKQFNKHGLCFTIFTTDNEIIQRAADEIKVGTLNINCDPVNPSLASPWGGVGCTGNGGPLNWADRFVNRKVINHG